MSPSPLVVPPSLEWAGDDGQWSTFYVSIGTPAQPLQVLPGTSAVTSTIFWTIIPQGCADVNPGLTSWPRDRGGIFHSNQSTSWSTEGLINHAEGALYNLVALEEGRLGRRANASYGYDTVSLDAGQSSLPVLQHQLIAGIWTNDFFLGMLPLSPLPFNLTFSNPVTSMLSILRNTTIPSLSWGYTAGAWYRDSGSNHFGSLTLGGYDASRFKINNVSFSFGPDISRDLLVQLHAITYDTATSVPLMASGVNIFIDSVVSELWLPVSVCQSFAAAFSLTYHSANYYLVNETAHNALLRQNPTFTFSISNGSASLDVVLPYAAFDLNLTAPIVGYSTRYFPIRRADNDTQYVLGRAFLQEAYVFADYDRRRFTVSQALFPASAVEPDIVAVYSPQNAEASGRTLTSGDIVGVAIGAVAAVAMLLWLCWLGWRRRREKHAQHHLAHGQNTDASLPLNEADAASPLNEADAASYDEKRLPTEAELVTKANAHELLHEERLHEMPSALRHEMPAPQIEPFELEAIVKDDKSSVAVV